MALPTPIFNDDFELLKLPKNYIHNLQASWGSATTLVVAAGECRDSSDQVDMTLDAPVTINAAVNGVNGLDTGSLAASTTYYVILLNDSSGVLNPCCILSASATSPVIPTVANVNATYDTARIVDYWMTDGSANLLKGYTYGTTNDRTRRWDTSVATPITAGASQTLAPIVLSAGVPPIAGCTALIEGIFTPNAAGNTCSFTPFGSTATVMQRIVGQASAVPMSREIEIGCPLNSGVPTALYINSAASGALLALINGFRYSV